MSAYTVILPHKRNPGNNRALRVALDCLETNARYDHHLIIDAAEDKPLYPRINSLVEHAKTDCVIYWSSDMFPAQNWDSPILELFSKDTIVVPIVVEPGVIGIHPANIEADFGRTPETFRREEFEVWAKTASIPNGYWPAPWCMSREAFLNAGGLQMNLQGDDDGFSPADQVFFEHWLSKGKYVKRARSFTYHIQRYSQLSSQIKENRIK